MPGIRCSSSWQVTGNGTVSEPRRAAQSGSRHCPVRVRWLGARRKGSRSDTALLAINYFRRCRLPSTTWPSRHCRRLRRPQGHRRRIQRPDRRRRSHVRLTTKPPPRTPRPRRKPPAGSFPAPASSPSTTQRHQAKRRRTNALGLVLEVGTPADPKARPDPHGQGGRPRAQASPEAAPSTGWPSQRQPGLLRYGDRYITPDQGGRKVLEASCHRVHARRYVPFKASKSVSAGRGLYIFRLVCVLASALTAAAGAGDGDKISSMREPGSLSCASRHLLKLLHQISAESRLLAAMRSLSAPG
jgi:hypothetical protein